jgi:uncharacterized protein YebE (UPF0316 family)
VELLLDHPYLPFLIFFARICDVTLGTLRIIFISKGKKYLAPLVGFLEVFIWIIVISRILTVANDLVSYFAYAAGYATGSYIGMLVEERLAIGMLLIRVFTKQNGKELVARLNKARFGATISIGEGVEGEVSIVETVINRKKAAQAEQIIAGFDAQAFHVVSDIRTVQRGIFPPESRLLGRWRIGK